MTDERPLYLIGFMGAGKTAVGARLAERLGWPCVDTDALVERDTGRSIERIFQESGERHFRAAERRALESLAGRTCLVVSAGGGLFLHAERRGFIRCHGRSVWLDVPLAIAAARAGSGAGRPRWRSDAPLALRAMFERRCAAYALADLRVDASADDPARVAEAVMRKIRQVFD